MFEGTNLMFDNFHRRMGKVKKKEYEINFASFMEENSECLREMLQYVANGDDKEIAAKEAATILFDNVTNQLGKRGRIKLNTSLDLSIYMIYYLFPAILKLADENSTVLCDAIRDEWRVRTKNPNYNYTDYDEVYKGFKEKLFGFF